MSVTGTRQRPHHFASITGEVHLVGCTANTPDEGIGRAIRADRGRHTIGRATIGRLVALDRSPVHAGRCRDGGGGLSPSVPARSAVERDHRNAPMRDEHFARQAARTRMVDSEKDAGVRAAACVIHVGGHGRFLAGRAPFMRGPLGDEAAIRRGTTRLDLKNAPVFEAQLENFAVLRNRR